MPQKDNVITKDLESVTFFLPGAFTNTGGGGVASNTLIKSTTGAGFVDSMLASQLDPSLTTTFRPSGTAYDLVTHLHGTFKTAFPDGKPGEEKPRKKPRRTAKTRRRRTRPNPHGSRKAPAPAMSS